MTAETPLIEYSNIVWRRKWYILLPAVLGVAVAALVLKKLPKEYLATAVVRQQVEAEPSKDYVRPVVGSLAAADPKVINDQVKSLDFINGVEQRTGASIPSWVPADQRKTFIKDAFWVDVQGTALNFTAQRGDAKIAADIANAAAAHFVETAGKKRAAQSEDFATWFGDRLASAKRDLDAKDGEIARFKDMHRGSLPEDAASNSAGLSAARAELSRVQADMASKQQEIDALLLHAGTMGVAMGTGTTLDPVVNLQRLESELATLLVTKTERHPDVVAKRAEIATYRKQVEAMEAATRSTSDAGSPALTLVERLRKESLERELETLRARETSIDRDVALYQARLAETGRLEPTMAKLGRERDEVAREYGTALAASQSAALGKDYVERSQPQLFSLELAATPPVEPVSPKPAGVLGIGLMLGLGIGVGLVVLLELLDQTYRYPEEIQAHFEVPVIATITRIGPREVRSNAAAAESRKAG